jgi:hypothetical protein
MIKKLFAKTTTALVSLTLALSLLSSAVALNQTYTVADALIVLKASAGLIELTAEQRIAYGIDSNTVSVRDALKILQFTINNAPTTQTSSVPQYIIIKGTQYNTDLTNLDLFGLGLTNADIEPLKYMINLTTLNLTYNNITDFSSINGLVNLTTLFIPVGESTNLSSLSGLNNVTTLIVSLGKSTLEFEESTIATIKSILPNTEVLLY